MKEGKFGPYCATPVRKSEDGQTVLEWCQFGQKPKSAKSNAQSEALVTIIKTLARIEAKIDAITPNGVRPVTSGGPLSEEKKLPF